MRAAGEPELTMTIGREIANTLLFTARFGDALDVLEEALTRVGRDSTEAQWLEADMLMAGMLDQRLLRRIIPLALRRIGQVHRGAQLKPALMAAVGIYMYGHYPPAARSLPVIEYALAHDGEGGLDFDAVARLGCAQVLPALDRFELAAHLHSSAIEDARRRGAITKLPMLYALRSEISLIGGAVLEAEAEARHARTAMDLAAETLNVAVVGQAWVASMLINVLVVRGRVEDAQAVLEEVLPPDIELRAWGAELYLMARAALREAQGRLPEAIDDLRGAGRALHPSYRNPAQNRWRGRLAILLAAAGERDEARALARGELEDARRFEHPPAIGAALVASGLAEGGPEGLARLEEAVAVLDTTGHHLMRARALLELGAAQRRAGARVTARDTLRVARDLASRCGATALGDRAYEELVTAGGRVRRDRGLLSGAESLTAGEHRVASLASQGLTNRQIAERLYVTQAAVQWHLRHVFPKLRISSRTQLAEALNAEPSQGGTSDAPAART